MDLQFKFAGGILCLITLISSLTSGAEVALQPRNAEVDFSKMPECSSAICASVLGALLDCGQEIMTDCFCGKPNPLACAWSVNWDCWNRTEDWYDTQCPKKPPVDLSGIPSCARSCFDKANICPEPTSNCVCSQPKPDCKSSTTTCTPTEVGKYDDWYEKSCKYKLTATSTRDSSPSATGPSTNSTSAASASPRSGGGGGGGGLSKGAIAGVALGAVMGTFALGVSLYFCWKRREPGLGCAAAESPGPHELEDSSNPKIRPDLFSGLVQPIPLVEAPGDHR
ncbi:hypothetical protein C7212DRAFT_274141 [Tuber magnatum]|uniref:Extracellular membrane protein CFEM domain-containing protein n=1 Tax=Tuber magnatum TaxID=42249 RepID=A0A317T4S9_9PEZI|nr:hypothetical protein C7212DRAFT_274141 [Tuber magnatum]